jgi:hypothetical protein
MDFIETMAEYLDGGRSWEGSASEIRLNRIEGKYPGFRDRYQDYLENVDGYRSTGDDTLLIELLHEGFVIDGIFEEDQIEQMRENLNRARKKAREFLAEDIGLTRKEE